VSREAAQVLDLSSELPPELQVLEPGERTPLQAVEGAAATAALRPEEGAVKPDPESSNDPAITRLRGTLPNVPLFSDLEPNPFTELIQRCPLRSFKEGQRVFEQGSRGDAFYIVCSGGVRVAREGNGFTQELARLQEGSFFGEMAILSDAPRTATVESTSDETQLLEISAGILQQLSRRYPNLAQALKKFCRQRLLSNVMNSAALFRPFTTQQRKDLIERFRARDVLKNTVLLREGMDSDGLYVVLSGEVEVRRSNTLVAHLKEGDVFGEMSLLTKSPAVATIISTRRTSLLRLPRAEFDSLIMSHPQVLELVAELTDHRRSWLESATTPKPEGPILV
jgi:CRP-like cAMP-binding protein